MTIQSVCTIYTVPYCLYRLYAQYIPFTVYISCVHSICPVLLYCLYRLCAQYIPFTVYTGCVHGQYIYCTVYTGCVHGIYPVLSIDSLHPVHTVDILYYPILYMQYASMLYMHATFCSVCILYCLKIY